MTFITWIISLLTAFTPSFGGPPVLTVPQGGTGAATFTSGECLKGNGTGPITTGACGGGSLSGGTANMLTSWVNSSTVTATGTPQVTAINATSSTATSTFRGNIQVDGQLFQGGVPVAAITTIVFVDSNRSDSYTSDGSMQRPYKTLTTAAAGITAKAYTSAAIHIAPGTYTEQSLSLPSIPLVIYGNGASILMLSGASVGAGTLTIGSDIDFYNPVIFGNLSLTATSLTNPHAIHNGFIAGNVYFAGNGTMDGSATVDQAIASFAFLSQNASSTVTAGSGSLVAISNSNIQTVLNAHGTLNLNTVNVQTATNTRYAITATTTGSALRINGASIQNYGTGGTINCANTANSSAPNQISNVQLTLGIGSTGAIDCGSATTFVGHYSAFTLAGTRLFSTGTDKQYPGMEGLLIDNRIGIASTTPGTPLSVNGAAVITDTVTAPKFAATSTTASSTFAGGVSLDNTTDSPRSIDFTNSVTNPVNRYGIKFYEGGLPSIAYQYDGSGSVGANKLVWSDISAGNADIMTLTRGGNLGLATTTPGTVFSVGTSPNQVLNFQLGTSTFYNDLALRNFTQTGTATSTFANGISLLAGTIKLPSACSGAAQLLQTDANGFVICGADDSSAGGGTYPFTPDTYGVLAVSATSSPIKVTSASAGFIASSTSWLDSIQFTTATGTTLAFPAITNKFLYTNNIGQVVGAASSSLSLPNTALQNSTISGISLGGTLGALSAGNTSLTFSGSYDGSAARTVTLTSRNINGTAFDGTANITITAASSTLLSDTNIFSTAATTTFSNGVSVGTFAQIGTATSTFNRGITLANGCFAIGINCIALSNLPGQITLTTQVTGILPIGNGGTNQSAFGTSNGVVYYDGTRLTNAAPFTFDGTKVTFTTGTTTYLTASTFLEIPDGASPLVNVASAIAFDSTDNQLLIGTSTNASFPAVIRTTEPLYRFRVSSTSAPFFTGFSASKNVGLPTDIDGWLGVSVTCSVWAGTSVTIALVGSTAGTSNSITCGTATSTTALTTNYTYAANESVVVNTTGVSGTPDFLYVTINGRIVRE